MAKINEDDGNRRELERIRSSTGEKLKSRNNLMMIATWKI
jgi:hypothetical protein